MHWRPITQFRGARFSPAADLATPQARHRASISGNLVLAKSGTILRSYVVPHAYDSSNGFTKPFGQLQADTRELFLAHQIRRSETTAVPATTAQRLDPPDRGD